MKITSIEWSHGYERSLLTSASHQTSVLRRQVAVRGMARSQAAGTKLRLSPRFPDVIDSRANVGDPWAAIHSASAKRSLVVVPLHDQLLSLLRRGTSKG